MLAPSRVPRAAEERLAGLLDRVARVRPTPSERARSELAVSLAALRDSVVGELAWEASCLTPSRFPVEVAFTSVSDELRTVVDVLAPESERARALDEADRVARLFGSAGLPPALRALVLSHQRRTALRFGAWLGSRHDPDRTLHKVYVEVDRDPERAHALAAAIAPAATRALAGIGAVRLVGIGLDAPHAVEVYARPPFADADAIRALAARGGVAHLADALAAAGRGEEAAGRNVVVSVAVVEDRVVAVSAIAFAHALMGRDGRVRARILAQALAEGWPSASLYAAASAPLCASAPLRRPVHTALSAVAAPDAGEIAHHVGMAPPPAHPRPGHPAVATRDRGERP